MSLWWQQLLLVMLGGALGAAGRFWLGGAMLRQLGDGIPWGTLAANLIGSFLAGFIVVWLEGRGSAALYWRAQLREVMNEMTPPPSAGKVRQRA